MIRPLNHYSHHRLGYCAVVEGYCALSWSRKTHTRTHKNLQDLVLIEEAFERLLLDYDRVFSAMGVPACLWRRTGEIYKGNREFSELVGVNGYMVRDVSIFTSIDCPTFSYVSIGTAFHLRIDS